MATQDYAASVQGAAIRVTRLSAAGGLLNGALDSYTTSAFIRMSFTPEYEDGEEITEKAADGTVCVSYKAPDRLKRATMELAICEPDPELSALLAGGVLLSKNYSTSTGSAIAATSAVVFSGTTVTITLASGHGVTAGGNATVASFTAPTSLNGIKRILSTDATTVTFASSESSATVVTGLGRVTPRDDTSVGWAAPAIGDDPSGNGVAIEVWSHAVANGKRAATNPYFHWIFPYARLRQSGDRVIENGMLANTFEGYGIGNTAFGTGPDTRWEWAEVTDRPYAYARSSWSPSLYHYKGFYTGWSATAAPVAVASLPVADVDIDTNVPGGEEYLSDSVTDIIGSDV
jgi:predicted outer membrane repeat protein